MARNGDVAPTFLVDGVVAGTWDTGGGKARREPTTITLRPVVRLAAADRGAVADEARRLLVWLHHGSGGGRVVWA